MLRHSIQFSSVLYTTVGYMGVKFDLSFWCRVHENKISKESSGPRKDVQRTGENT